MVATKGTMLIKKHGFVLKKMFTEVIAWKSKIPSYQQCNKFSVRESPKISS